MTEPTFAELMREAHAGLLPPDDVFRARRTSAEAARRLIDAMLARAASAEDHDALASELDALRAKLETRPERAGLSANVGTGGMPRFVDMARELNPVNGTASPIGLPLSMWRDDARAWGTIRFDRAFEGPPGHVHGGYVAAVFDQFLGFAQCIAGGAGVTGKLELRYVRPTRLGVELTLEAEVKERVGRLTYVSGKLRDGDVITAKAKAMFVDMGGLKP